MTRKLYSLRGTLLGTITYPDSWDMTLFERGRVSFAVTKPLPLMPYRASPVDTELAVRTGVIEKAYCERGAVHLHNVTPEEFEQTPGCSFAPGAGYLRSLVE